MKLEKLKEQTHSHVRMYSYMSFFKLCKKLYFIFHFLVSAGLWGLVNNAGIAYISPIEWTPLDVFKRTADVNLWGMIDVTKTFLPLVKKSKGRVVNLSSMAGKAGIDEASFGI